MTDFQCRGIGERLLPNIVAELFFSLFLREYTRWLFTRCKAVIEDCKMVVDRTLADVVEDDAPSRRSGGSML